MAKVLIIDDEAFITKSLKHFLERERYEVVVAGNGEQGIESFKAEIPDLVLLDINLPDMGGLETLSALKALSSETIVVMITAHGDIETAVSAIKLGAYDFLEKPFDLTRLSLLIQKALETVNLKRELDLLKKNTHGKYGFGNIIAISKRMSDVVSLAKKVSESDINMVLIQGESGTGKNLLAKAIHYNSKRASAPFVEVTSTAIPEALLESELFGYEKGAFTDAKTSKKGLFELAEGGTIYLDEIGDAKASTQAKLLRAVEEKTFKRVGGLKDITVNVRVIAATNKNLENAVRDGSFRTDLYYRLKVVPIFAPPLRERREDILPLAMHFISSFNGEFKKKVMGIDPEASRLLLDYAWHGNIRELKNVIERICLLEETEIIYAEHIPPEIVEHARALPGIPAAPLKAMGEGMSLKLIEKNIEEELVMQALKRMDGNQTRAARLLGISRDMLRYKMQKFGMLNKAV